MSWRLCMWAWGAAPQQPHVSPCLLSPKILGITPAFRKIQAFPPLLCLAKYRASNTSIFATSQGGDIHKPKSQGYGNNAPSPALPPPASIAAAVASSVT